MLCNHTSLYVGSVVCELRTEVVVGLVGLQDTTIMASNYSRLCWICVSILFFVRIEGISASGENNYFQYTLLKQDKSPSTLPTLRNFESLPNEGRTRRYVNGPISKLADAYNQGKSRFISNPQALTGGYVSPHVDSPAMQKETKSSYNSSQAQPAPDTSENRVHTTVSQSPLTTQINNNKPPVIPPAPNISSIVSADFDSTLTSTLVPTIEDELPFNKYNDEVINNTINQNNLTKREDNHLFYSSSFIIDSKIGQSYWVDMSGRNDVTTNNMLSQSHRRAATVKLLFNFPFYGHMVRNVTIATGGFLYTGDYVHSWLAATQYIAPLMANFDTSISNGSYIKYVDNGTAFTVQWEKVVLQDKPDSGDFTFQATLHANGDIVFVYQSIPVDIENIKDDQHPVKVGLSDAYIIDRTIFFVRRKTIYEYHRVNFKKEDIKNWTVIYLKALPTCLNKKDCESCLTPDTGFDCTWCPVVKRCSTGMDRFRQDWLHKECDKIESGNISNCNLPDPKHSQQTSADSASVKAGLQVISDDDKSTDEARMGMSGILGALFLIVLICGVGIWALYAYNNPHSSSGQILIRYRPSQWSWRRGEARYTAATIHM